MLIFLSAVSCKSDLCPELIPLPQNCAVSGRSNSLPEGFAAWSNDALMCGYLSNYFAVAGDSGSAQIVFFRDSSKVFPAEGYTLVSGDGRVTVTAADYAGLFNGAQTLLQLLPNDVVSCKDEHPFRASCTLPAVEIEDFPAFAYRGQHLDVARTFIPLDQIKRFIDNISHFKINKLHLHLCDDESWRVEIKAYPELALTGGFRGGDSPIFPTFSDFDRKYGGYYTQDELHELVAYAAERNVEIIPEIDLPGHSLALGKIHPELLCPTGATWEASCGYDMRNVLCTANEEVYAFIDTVLGEIAGIFPSKYIHVGGDEVNFDQWKSCPHCSALFEKSGFTSYAQLETMFLLRIERILRKYGRSMSVWNEAGEGDQLPMDIHVYGWKSPEACVDMTTRGYKTVIMPAEYCYFDMLQSPGEPGATWNGVVDVEKTYSLNLARAGYTDTQLANVIGFEGAFWTELLAHNSIENPGYLDYMVFPRSLALSEIAWTENELRSWDSFNERLHSGAFPYMDALGIAYRPGDPEPRPELKTPSVSISTSMPVYSEPTMPSISSYENFQGEWTKCTCRNGDWIQYDFSEIQDFDSIEIITGHDFIPRAHFAYAHALVSSDGTDYEYAGELLDGRWKSKDLKGIKSIRIVCTADGNGTDHVIINFPRIY